MGGIAAKKGALLKPLGDRVGETAHHLLDLADQNWEKHKNPVNPCGAKAAVKLKDKNDRTPLAVAVRQKNIDMVALLLEHKADIEALDKNGNTILIDAVLTGVKVIALPILEAKARVDRHNKDKKTALDLCTSPIIKQLLEMYLISSNVQKGGETKTEASTTALPAIPSALKATDKKKEKAEADNKVRLVTLSRVRIENLSKAITGDLLEDHVRGLIHRIHCPDPTRLEVPVDPITSRPRGWAYVDFVDAKAAELAVRGHGEMLLGLIVRAVKDGTVTMEYEDKDKTETRKSIKPKRKKSAFS